MLCFAHVGASLLGLYQGNSQFLMFRLDSFLASVHYVTAQSLIRFLFFFFNSFIRSFPTSMGSSESLWVYAFLEEVYSEGGILSRG